VFLRKNVFAEAFKNILARYKSKNNDVKLSK